MILLALAAAACLAVAPQSDRVFARDLASQFPALLQAPPDAVVGFAPFPGATRVLSAPELTRIAAHLGITAQPPDEICLDRPVAVLDPNRLREAMRKLLPDAQIEIADFSRAPAPQGEIEFRLADLHPGSPEGSLWRGSIRYAGARRFSIWANVKISQSAVRVTAIGDLPIGRPIAAGTVLVQTLRVFPEAAEYASTLESVVGRIPRIFLRAGSAIRLSDLDVAKDVMRGDAVRVSAISGTTRIELDAIAETSGSAGARIEVRNPSSNKTFFARVEAKGKATVDMPLLKGME